MDTVDKEKRSENMRRIRSKDMKPELQIRRLVFAMGYRYRLHRKDLPGKPDLVFPSRRKVIFVNGCFWHRHDKPGCTDSRLPKSNRTYWRKKLNANRQRDEANELALKRGKWRTLVIWECDLAKPDCVVSRIRRFLGPVAR